MQKEIPILRALIQNLYQELDRKFHLNGAKIPITFGFDTDSLGSYTRRHLQQVPDPANTGNASDHFWTLEKRIRQDKKNLGVLIADHIGVWYSKEKIKKSKENINISY